MQTFSGRPAWRFGVRFGYWSRAEAPRTVYRVAGPRLIVVTGALALALAACSDGSALKSQEAQTHLAQAYEPTVKADQFVVVKRLAIAHMFTLRLPSIEVEAIQKKHLAECSKLGCTVLNTQLDRSNEGRISARSSVRISPDAYATFVGIITAPPSDLVAHSETAEDKTLAMLDVDKRLEVKLALRDRLSAMLKEPGAKSAADLAAIEKELAQVQGDIEAATAQRDYLRTITETLRVDILYNGRPKLVSGVDLSPISLAVNGIGRTVVASVAALISFLAALVPWLPLIAFLGWAVRRSLRRWKASRTHTSVGAIPG